MRRLRNYSKATQAFAITSQGSIKSGWFLTPIYTLKLQDCYLPHWVAPNQGRYVCLEHAAHCIAYYYINMHSSIPPTSSRSTTVPPTNRMSLRNGRSLRGRENYSMELILHPVCLFYNDIYYDRLFLRQKELLHFSSLDLCGLYLPSLEALQAQQATVRKSAWQAGCSEGSLPWALVFRECLHFERERYGWR